MNLNIDLDRLGDLIATIGSRDFANAFYGLFRDLIAIDECIVFSFPASETPQRMIVENASDEERAIALRLAEDYVAGGYRNDPNLSGMQGATVTAYVVDPENITDLTFREHYYDTPEISQELVVQGSVSGTLYYMSFFRKHGCEKYSAAELQLVQAIGGIIVKALHRHNELVVPVGDERFTFVPRPTDAPSELRERTLEHLRDVLLASSYKLSNREAEICAGIVMGYSTLAISLNCSISPNTVATHRKRAYAKMGISSQNELFTRYFSTVTDFQTRAGRD